MPAAAAPGRGGVQGRPRGPVMRLPPAPPAPPAPSPFTAIAHAVEGATHAAASIGKRITAPAPKGGGSDVQTSGPNYGSSEANAYKQSASYKKAVGDVFAHQPLPQKAAILTGLMHTPNAFKSPEGQAIKSVWQQMPVDQKVALQTYLPHSTVNVDRLLSLFVNKAAGNYGGKGPPSTGNLAALSAKGSTLQRLGVNAGKDLINLPGEAVTTVGTLGGDILAGNPSKLVSDFIAPYKQLLAHPYASIVNHPLDAYLMAAGVLHGGTRLGAGAVRTAAPESAAGRALGTSREGVALTGKLTHERPRSSPYPLIQAGQKARDSVRFERSATGALVPRSKSYQDRLVAQGVSRIVGINERIRRINRDATANQRIAAVRPKLAVRVGHSAKTSLKRGPQEATIPGADVLARIADGTIRRPDTFTQDLEAHLRQVSANRPNLLDNPKLLKEHDAYVKALQASLSDRRLSTPSGLRAAFAAADKYAKDYAPVEREAHSLGQFGSATRESLTRRTLMHYAVTHMGAKYEEGVGLVGARGGLLSTETILRHMRSDGGTGGRRLAFTSDRPKAGSAFYQSSERRPLPQTQRNTLFAYTHGLTDPSHVSLLEQHVRMQGIVDAHKAQNRIIDSLAVQKPGGGWWKTFKDAKASAPPGYRPINLSEPFHQQAALDQALHDTHPAALDEEAVLHSLDISSRLQPGGSGRWGLVSDVAMKRIEEHKGQIASDPVRRAFKGLNNQFRKVALGTSAKHIPGVIQEGLIRDIASGVGLQSWLTGRRIVKTAERVDPEKGREAGIALKGGTVAGATTMAITRQVSDHFAGTDLHGFLKAFETTMRTPGLRQVRSAWNAWLRFAINGTKRYIEEQNQTAGLGKAALMDFGAEHGPFFKALRLQGQMLEDAARGIVDPAKQRQLRSEIERIYGKWTELTPSGQTLMMFSPFGLWWTNSVKWLLRLPVDHPVKTGLLASATVGTEKQRQSEGLNFFDPGSLPGYEQGGIPVGGKIAAQNYYSPFGVVNDPLATASSLLEPWLLQPAATALYGVNWLGHPLESPSNPKGRKPSNAGARAQYILNSVLSSFIPLYTKAQQVAEGGASAYDVSPNFPVPATKKPGKGPLAGAEKALTPIRLYKPTPPAGGGVNLNDVAIPGGSGSSGSSGGSGGVNLDDVYVP